MYVGIKLILMVLEKRLHLNRIKNDNRGFGMGELLGIAAALIIAAFVIIPGLRTFAKSVMDGLSDWWTDTISEKMFPTA
ncbi:MAG TPA: hypothetical protein VHT96_04250 [Clostridia bacterium]|nr:hypothetical protein [Clostridia bacterium]